MKAHHKLFSLLALIFISPFSTANPVGLGISFEENAKLLPSPPGVIFQENTFTIRWLGTAADSISEYRIYLACKNSERKFLGSEVVQGTNKDWYFFTMSGHFKGCIAEVSAVDKNGLEGHTLKATVIEKNDKKK